MGNKKRTEKELDKMLESIFGKNKDLGLSTKKKTFCECQNPIYNYPEMVWCDNCTKEIVDKPKE